jgi:hexokinase
MRRALRAIVGEKMEKMVNVGMAKDGSGVGGTTIALFKLRVC